MTRHTVDTITSDALDALYERLAVAEHEADASVTAATQLATLVGKRSEKAEKTAKAQQRRAEIAEAELRTLRAGLRANGADPTQIQNLWAQIHLRNRQWRDEKQRAERAEAALARVRALCSPDQNSDQLGHLRRSTDVLAALDGKSSTPAPAVTEATDTATTTRVFAALHRSAEQDVTRVIDLYERWVKAGPPPLGTPVSRWWDKRLVELHDAIRPPTDGTREQP